MLELGWVCPGYAKFSSSGWVVPNNKSFFFSSGCLPVCACFQSLAQLDLDHSKVGTSSEE